MSYQQHVSRFIDSCWLPWLASISCLLYAAIAYLSGRFAYGQPFQQRPIPTVLFCFGLAFFVYLLALRCALRLPPKARLLGWIVGPAVAFRLILLCSAPIQEVDVYRYLWDGAVTATGVSPFRYSPHQVATADRNDVLPADLTKLVTLRDSSPAQAAILKRVHYGELPTIYPPVSQAVFAIVAWLTPDSASVSGRIVLFKSVMLLFDLGTIGVVLGLLRAARKHLGWSIAYAWCPLVLKEFANSGHLDAIAVFFCMAGVWYTVRTALRLYSGYTRQVGQFAMAAALLALAVGAKLYPIVLAPWFAVLCYRRVGLWRTLPPLVVLVGLSTVLIRPMFPVAESTTVDQLQTQIAAADIPVPRPADDYLVQDPSRGLATFMRRWEMNDFLFMLVFENVRSSETESSVAPWFSILPQRLRAAVVDPLVDRWDFVRREAAFQLTRLVTSIALVAVALWAAVRVYRFDDPHRWLESAFLTLAWLWLLSPTQNPWYWIWALPLVAFARSRCWLAVSGLVLLYYLRFWFDYQWPGLPVLGTPYRGAAFFDFCVTWLEFAPWFALLLLETIFRKQAGADSVTTASARETPRQINRV